MLMQSRHRQVTPDRRASEIIYVMFSYSWKQMPRIILIDLVREVKAAKAKKGIVRENSLFMYCY